MKLSPKKTVLFALTAVVLSGVVSLGVLLALDLYAHSKFERAAGLNVWGYRGRVAGKKQPGELRVVVVGGSTALGYGVPAGDAMPAHLERYLNAGRTARGQGPVSVVNLGFNNEGAYGYRFTLIDYRYLNYDGVVLYTGYNDEPAPFPPNLRVGRRASPLFRLTGYYPILPEVLSEKVLALRHGGDHEGAYRGDKTVFRPNLADRPSIATVETAERISRSLEEQLARSAPASQHEKQVSPDCMPRWSFFCASIEAATDYALQQGAWVIVGFAPNAGGAQSDQEAALVARLATRYTGESRVRHVGLAQAVDVKDRSMAFDGMHLTAAGNARVAAELAPVVHETFR